MTEAPPRAAKMTRTLAADYYTSAEIFDQEIKGALSQTWQFACHSSELVNIGDYVTCEIAKQNLFCIRGRDDVIRTFYNVCQHRAHELVSGTGNCRVVVCPYHAWAYELDGPLRGGPNINHIPESTRAEICLTPVKTEIFNGFVFVNLDPDAEPMSEWFPNVAEQLRSFAPDIEKLHPLEWVEVKEACNWKVSVENYSECYHCTLNHRAFASGVINPQTYDIQPQGHCLRHTTQCQNLDRMSYPIDPNSNEHAGDYSSWFLWPTFSFQAYPGNILNTYHWRPISVDEVVVWRGWYTVDGEESQIIRDLAQQDRETTVEEDIRLVESVQRGLNSRGYNPGPLVVDPNAGVNSEHSLLALHDWMRNAST